MTVYIDRIDTLDLQEKYGMVVSLTRKAFVNGLSGTNYDVMYDVLTAAGVPAKYSILDSNNPQLILQDRNVTMTDPDSAEVILVYGRFNDPGQRLFWDTGNLSMRAAAGKMTASVQQKTTNMYRENGKGAQKIITLEHTYPSTDEDYANKTVKQSGEITVYVPQKTFAVEGIKETRKPWIIAKNLLACVNKATWHGEKAYTWMCTEVAWEYRRADQYYMSFQFQHDEDTWNPTAVFIDDRTGRPPEGLVENVGYKNIRYHKAVDFSDELGFLTIGES